LATLGATAEQSISLAGNKQLQRGRLSVTLASITATVPLVVFNLALVERKWKVLMNRGPFLVKQPLQWWEKILFVSFSAAAILLLVVSASTALWWVIRRLMGRQPGWMAKLTVLPVALAYLAAATVQYKVFQYFRDGLNLVLIRGLGGGDWLTALRYVQDEFAGLLPAIAASFVVMVVGGWLVRKYSRRLAAWLARRWPVQVLASPWGLLTANAMMIVSPWLLSMASFPLHENLGFGIAYHLYSLPATVLTDFDTSRHLYAMGIAGNGSVADSIAGEAPKVVWRRQSAPWDASRLERKNVLLLVLESARYDLLDARVDGAPVMPVLNSLPGERLLMFSHAGYTAPSLGAIFNGTVDEREAGGISLVDRFRELGYQTGVFSGQYEGFGDISARTHMNRADVFVDASSFPREQRMYPSATAAGLSVPAPLVTERFRQWFKSIDRQRPFFAYLNWQEMHFPYHYWGAPTPLANPPISRGEIVPGKRDWLERTYWNAARNLDSVLAGLLIELDQAGVRSQTVILVVGDHGEELFDHGYLGHGTNISFEQNATVAKIINSNWKPPRRAFGLRSVSGLIHNALIRRPEDALPVDEDFFCYIGSATKPSQLAAVTSSGIVKFDFRKNLWTKQAAPGEEFAANPSFPPLIYLWESYLQQLPAPDGR
jgi:phosphoglycerol transferase MdoB-like AlkP superfamily enzyme